MPAARTEECSRRAICARKRVRLPAVVCVDSKGVYVRDGGYRGVALYVVEMLTKWVQTTRLETRTKESNMCASVWVANPNAE